MDKIERTLLVKSIREAALEEKGLRSMARQALRARGRHLADKYAKQSARQKLAEDVRDHIQGARRNGSTAQRIAAGYVLGESMSRATKAKFRKNRTADKLRGNARMIQLLREDS